MLDPLTQDNLAAHLAAFADGELDAAQSLALWTFLETSPGREAALRQMKEQQQLTQAARRSLHSTAPSDLRARLTALPVDVPTMKIVPAKSWRRRVPYPIAVAAGLMVGVSASAFLMRAAPTPDVLPGDLVMKVGRVHAECSRLPEAMHDATFEAVDAKLATTVRASLNTTADAPDFTAAGFHFVGAGPCHGAGAETVHLLYRSIKAPNASAISLFVQPDAGQYPRLAESRVYRVSSPTSPFPTLAWRSGSVIYVLLADSDKTEAVVLQLIHPTPADEIVTVASR